MPKAPKEVVSNSIEFFSIPAVARRFAERNLLSRKNGSIQLSLPRRLRSFRDNSLTMSLQYRDLILQAAASKRVYHPRSAGPRWMRSGTG